MSNFRKYLLGILVFYSLIMFAGIITSAAGWYRTTTGLLFIAALSSTLVILFAVRHAVNSFRTETRNSRAHLIEHTSSMTRVHQQFEDEVLIHARELASELALIRVHLDRAQSTLAGIQRLSEQNVGNNTRRDAAERRFHSELENSVTKILENRVMADSLEARLRGKLEIIEVLIKQVSETQATLFTRKSSELITRLEDQASHLSNLPDEIVGINTRLDSLDNSPRTELQSSVLHRPLREDLPTTGSLSSDNSADSIEVQNQANLDKLAHKINGHITRTARDATRQLEAVIHLAPTHLVDKDLPMPSTGGFAIDAQALSHLLSLVKKHNPSKILEVGSGSSTIWLGYMCRVLESKLVSVDHLEEYLTKTRTFVEKHGLSDTVETRLAPLEPTEFHGETYNWYSRTAFEDISEVDLLFVDGPPEVTGKMARLPALPNLLDALSSDALVILDDTQRKDETQILNEWMAAYPDFEQVEIGVSRLGVLRRKA